MWNIFPKRKLTMTEEVLTMAISGAAFVVFVIATPIVEVAQFVSDALRGGKNGSSNQDR